MKKLCKTLLILTIIVLITGCSFKGSMGQPIDNPNESETSQLQQDIEELIENDDTLEEKAKEYEKTINEMLEQIKSQENENENVTE